MDCEDQRIITTLKADGVKELKLKVEPRVKQEIDRNTMALDMFDGFGEDAEEFIEDIGKRRLRKSAAGLKPKDVNQEIDGNVVVLDMFKLFDEEEQELIREDKWENAEYIDGIKSEIFANTSVEEFISEPKKSMPSKIIPEKRKWAGLSQRVESTKIVEPTTSDPKLANVSKVEIPTNYLNKHERDVLNITDTSEKSHGNIKLNPHECEFCGKNYASYSKCQIERHIRTHTGERPYKCSYCPKTFADADTVTKHHRTHTNERPYVCGICGKSFKTNKLSKHEREMHNMIKAPEAPRSNVKPKPFECETCGRTFAQKPHLTRHMMTHTGERPYKCSYCPATFADPGTVKKHHRTHTNERPYVCDICNKSFISNCLKAHKREAHNIFDFGEKSQESIKPKLYYCEKCEKTFTQKGNLNRHMRNKHGHSKQAENKLNKRIKNPKLYEFETCGNNFRKPYIKRHMRVQVGERLYKFSDCPTTFKDSNILRQHHRLHTNERP